MLPPLSLELIICARVCPSSFESLTKENEPDRSILHTVGDLNRDVAFAQKVRDYAEKAGLTGKFIFHGRV